MKTDITKINDTVKQYIYTGITTNIDTKDIICIDLNKVPKEYLKYIKYSYDLDEYYIDKYNINFMNGIEG